jgi:hypothetical protein
MSQKEPEFVGYLINVSIILSGTAAPQVARSVTAARAVVKVKVLVVHEAARIID